jgi:hypothetical protein
VAQLLEDMKGLGDAIGRQVLRTRRSFTATVFSADGIQVIFKLRRPMYLINSTMFIEDALGNTIGEVRQKWHPIRSARVSMPSSSQFRLCTSAHDDCACDCQQTQHSVCSVGDYVQA